MSDKPLRQLKYKVAETSLVHDQALEAILNEHAALGWEFDSIQFVQQAGTRRPVMAFVLFTRMEETTVDTPLDWADEPAESPQS